MTKLTGTPSRCDPAALAARPDRTPLACIAPRIGARYTASHNPRDDNGCKLVLAGRTVHGAGIQALRERMERGGAPAAKRGRLTQADVFPAYRERIGGDIRLARPQRIVLDCGVGGASSTTPVLILRFEGDTPQAMQRIEGEMLALLRTVKPDAEVAGEHA